MAQGRPRAMRSRPIMAKALMPCQLPLFKMAAGQALRYAMHLVMMQAVCLPSMRKQALWQQQMRHVFLKKGQMRQAIKLRCVRPLIRGQHQMLQMILHQISLLQLPLQIGCILLMAPHQSWLWMRIQTSHRRGLWQMALKGRQLPIT